MSFSGRTTDGLLPEPGQQLVGLAVHSYAAVTGRQPVNPGDYVYILSVLSSAEVYANSRED